MLTADQALRLQAMGIDPYDVVGSETLWEEFLSPQDFIEWFFGDGWPSGWSPPSDDDRSALRAYFGL